MAEATPAMGSKRIGSDDPGRAHRHRDDGLEFPVSSTVLERVHRQLATTADQRGLLDVVYECIDTPIGPLLLAATPAGLVRVAFQRENFDAVLEQLAQKVSARILRSSVRLEPVVAQINQYFARSRHDFDVALDYRLSAGFREQVQRYLPQISYGTTQTYGQVAASVGHPKAARAVGSACATNPLPLVVPCHRVVRTDGTAGGYLGGAAAKKLLLDLESSR